MLQSLTHQETDHETAMEKRQSSSGSKSHRRQEKKLSVGRERAGEQLTPERDRFSSVVPGYPYEGGLYWLFDESKNWAAPFVPGHIEHPYYAHLLSEIGDKLKSPVA